MVQGLPGVLFHKLLALRLNHGAPPFCTAHLCPKEHVVDIINILPQVISFYQPQMKEYRGIAGALKKGPAS
jgi:hypothetical protein